MDKLQVNELGPDLPDLTISRLEKHGGFSLGCQLARCSYANAMQLLFVLAF